MKKIKFKPSGTLAEKFHINWFLVSLMMALCISACSDEDEDESAPFFPQKQTVNCSAGETRDLTFEVNENWQLISSATWCMFVVNGNEEYSTSGNAGTQTITLKITDESLSYDAKTVANLTLLMGGQEAIIAEVVRNVKGRDLKIYDADGNEIHEITVGYDSYQTFIVEANFYFAATNRPEWLDIKGGSIVGSANTKVTAGVRAATDNANYYKYAQEGTLTFTDEEGLASFDIPLVYAGMSPDAINISTPVTNMFGWTVSLDGKTFRQAGTNTAAFVNYVPFTVEAFNDDYVRVYLMNSEWGYYCGIDEADITEGDELEEELDNSFVNWIHLTGSEGNLNLKVDEVSSDREGCVLVFPRSEYNQLKEDYRALDEEASWNYNNFLQYALINDGRDGNESTEIGEIFYKYQQRNLLIQFTQQEDKTDNSSKELFAIQDGMLEKHACAEYTGNFKEEIIETYGTTDIMSIKYEVGVIYIVAPAPLLTTNEWAYDAILYDPEGTKIENSNIKWGGNNYYDTSNWDNYPAMSVCFNKNPWMETFLVFTDDSSKKRVLVFTPF